MSWWMRAAAGVVAGGFGLAGAGLMAQVAAVPPATPPTAAEVQAAAKPTHDATWWKHAVVYEIYPRSFQDSNGDGVGDLNGITQRLDYLQKLGVDAIWIAPMFPSPQVDFGYDVSDYEAVDPQYGSLADMDRLIKEAQKRNIRICLDWVVNHTSDKHKWFEESASSRTNPKADWFVWNDGKPLDPNAPEYVKKAAHDGMMPPNNWESGFGGSAWEWVPARKQFYYHKFYIQQPDLNWRNPAVEKAMFDGMRFWMDRGVAGFRLDAVPTLFEDPQNRDEPVEAGTNQQGDPNLKGIYTDNLPEVHGVIRRMRQVVDSYPKTGFPGSRVLIGETYLPNTAELDQWYGGASQNELQLPMDMLIGFRGNQAKLNVPYLRRYLTEVETEVHGSQPLLVFDNHDNVRSHDRYGDGVHDAAIDRAIATMLLTSKATALMYYGEELGMVTTTPTRVEDVKDPIGITGWPKEKGRDGERTPMQWNASTDAGFSTAGKMWLPVPPDYTTVNVAGEEKDPASLLKWYEKLIALRRSVPALHDGGVVFVDTANPDVLSYVRTAPTGAKPVVVSMNLSAQPQTVKLDMSAAGVSGTKLRTLVTDVPALEKHDTTSDIELPPYGSLVAEVQ
ncbi:glycoside hydrolase family 13 protein [Terriglobus sp.]|uniref:glycoside hydrolase family 13 protein n=1 Tax=Terriglobus sp. TaxID=1889013 RepID=UPI003B00B573